MSLSVETEVVLRDYQRLACRQIVANFVREDKQSQLLVLPTGAGKTVVFCQIAKWAIQRLSRRTLILAHRYELLDQAANKFVNVGLSPAFEVADSYARSQFDPDCVVASVQTMQGARLKSWPRDYFGLIVTDEAHHAVSASYGHIYKHFSEAWHLGVTATADRLDKKSLGRVFQCVAYEYTLREAIEQGYLSRLKIVQCVTGVDLSDVKTTGKDLNQGDLEAAITPHIATLANAIKQEIGDRQTIVYTPDVGSAEAFASALSGDATQGGLGISAESISGDDKFRSEKMSRFRASEFQVLVNCQIATEGLDVPQVSAIVLCRPTKSRALTVQMIGRGTRLHPGKSDCLVVDFAWLTGSHSLVSPVELFDTTGVSAKVIEAAKKLVESGQEEDLLDAIEHAEEASVAEDLLDAIKRAEKADNERVMLALKVKLQAAKYKRRAFDPFALEDALRPEGRHRVAESSDDMATQAQVAMLQRLRVERSEGMSRIRASQLISTLLERKSRGLCTHRQLAYLIAKGVDPKDAREMTFAAASRYLDQA